MIIFKKEAEPTKTKGHMANVETQVVDYLLFKIELYIYVLQVILCSTFQYFL